MELLSRGQQQYRSHKNKKTKNVVSLITRFGLVKIWQPFLNPIRLLSFPRLGGSKVRARWPLCGASPVLLQTFSSVIESDGWAVPARHCDVWTTARNPNLRRGQGQERPLSHCQL